MRLFLTPAGGCHPPSSRNRRRIRIPQSQRDHPGHRDPRPRFRGGATRPILLCSVQHFRQPHPLPLGATKTNPVDFLAGLPVTGLVSASLCAGTLAHSKKCLEVQRQLSGFSSGAGELLGRRRNPPKISTLTFGECVSKYDLQAAVSIVYAITGLGLGDLMNAATLLVFQSFMQSQTPTTLFKLMVGEGTLPGPSSNSSLYSGTTGDVPELEWVAFGDRGTTGLTVGGEDLGARFITDLYALMGKDGTWWAGAAWGGQLGTDVWDTCEVVMGRLVDDLNRIPVEKEAADEDGT
ncbi:hypothetical protein MKZ38_007439 [Zalerion maritima]|uniref:Uncharacterized protein n=1 Tax=Zalerion maritima TaxID=339359 RepID=A0AAD5RWK1_9PEZI|nr:hypothetical protein MKZ38_007439 [Zalerion maritima]